VSLATEFGLDVEGVGAVEVDVIVVKASEAGLASGLINTSQQIGGALGIAALSTIATSRTEDSLATATILLEALVDGFSSAFLAGAPSSPSSAWSPR
jgi:hypothetical protein